MTDEVKKIVEELTRKAKEDGVKTKNYKLTSGGSSLHKIIKTPAQAKRFMLLLEASYTSDKK